MTGDSGRKVEGEEKKCSLFNIHCLGFRGHPVRDFNQTVGTRVWGSGLVVDLCVSSAHSCG